MTAKITIEVPPSDTHAVRLGIEHENASDVEIIHVAPGTSWTGYVFAGARIVEISEVRIADVMVGRTHIARLCASM